MILKCLGTNAVNSLSNSGYAKCIPVPAHVLRAFDLPAMLCQWCLVLAKQTVLWPAHYHAWSFGCMLSYLTQCNGI